MIEFPPELKCSAEIFEGIAHYSPVLPGGKFLELDNERAKKMRQIRDMAATACANNFSRKRSSKVKWMAP